MPSSRPWYAGPSWFRHRYTQHSRSSTQTTEYWADGNSEAYIFWMYAIFLCFAQDQVKVLSSVYLPNRVINQFTFSLLQQFSIPVLAYPPALHILHVSLIDTQIPVWSERVCSIQRASKCGRREFKLYLFTEVYYVTLHASLVSFVCVWRCCRLWRSANLWMNVPEWSKLQQISPAQGVGSNGHCVGSMSIRTQFMHGAHFYRADYLNQVC